MSQSMLSPIAIVGVSYRAPGVGRRGLYEFLAEAKSGFSAVPRDRFEQEAYCHHDSEKAGVFAPKGAHFLTDDIYAFDAQFFNMTEEEATSMDPQQRLMLECALEASENAGLPLHELAGSRTGVFAAMDRGEYGERLADDLPTATKFAAPGTSGNMMANRVSYFLDLKGPSVSVDSACSSSAHAVHLACQSLRLSECSMAFVGAASLVVNANGLTALDTMGALSPDGRCYSYDARGNGFGRGEGAACLILKKLDEAIAAGDPIHAVIKHTAGNHSGKTRGITMPSQSAQEDILSRVHTEIGLDPTDTAFVEGHGTGTQVGDPIDAGAVANIIGTGRQDQVCIGSLKSNFGHLLGASGMLAMVKAILMFRHDKLLPNHDFQRMNPKIDATKVRVLQKSEPWPPHLRKRIVLTNFGFGGSNTAVLLERFDDSLRKSVHEKHLNGTSSNGHGEVYTNGTGGDSKVVNGHSNGASKDDSNRLLFMLSAKSSSSLSEFVSSLASHLENVRPRDQTQYQYLSDLSYTLCQRRTHFPHRLALNASSVDEVVGQLKSLPATVSGKANFEGGSHPAFVFTGQGAQYADMASGLWAFAVFADTMAKAETLLKQLGADWSLRAELSKPEPDGSRINEAEISQPACTAIQIAIVDLLRHWGVTPDLVMGHSSGEIAAAYAAGLLTFKAAMAIAFFRGQATTHLQKLQNAPKGGMIALGTNAETALRLIESVNTFGQANIAAFNSPQSVTVTGDLTAIEAIEQVANVQGLFNRKLKVTVAYHSHHMELVSETYKTAIRPYCDDMPSSKHGSAIFFSSVTNRIENGKLVTMAEYWVNNLVSPVKFQQALEGVVSSTTQDGASASVLIEVGPHAALKGPIKQTLQDTESKQLRYLPSLVRREDPSQSLLNLAGQLYLLGHPLHFENLLEDDGHTKHRVLADLPSYEWNKKSRYVHKSPVAVAKSHPGHTYTPLLGWKMPATGNEHIFRQVFTLDEMPWIRDHRVVGDVLFPFSGFVSLAVDGFRAVTRATPDIPSFLIKELHARRGLQIEEDQRVDLSTCFRPAETGTGSFSAATWVFEIMSWSESTGWTVHVNGRIEVGGAGSLEAPSAARDHFNQLLQSSELTAAKAEDEYQVFDKSGVSFGPTFKRMVALWADDDVAIHETRPRDVDTVLSLSSRGSQITVDPPTLDTMFHSVVVVANKNHLQPRPVFVPIHVSSYEISNQIPMEQGQSYITFARRQSIDEKSGRLEIEVLVFVRNQCHDYIPCLQASMTMQRITQSDSSIDSVRDALPKGYYEALVPHVGLTGGRELAEHLTNYNLDPDEIMLRRQLSATAHHFIRAALDVVSDDDLMGKPAHFKKFMAWARKRVQEPSDVEVTPSLLEHVSGSGATGQLLCNVGKNIPQILRGEIEPLEIMMKDGLLTRHYEDDKATHKGSFALSKYVQGLGELNPALRVLEIGAGTGSATLPILRALSGTTDDSALNFSSYVFTDISSGFFEDAKRKLSAWPELTYKKLDISRDPAEQGFEKESFDLIIATNVLHATPDIEVTIKNVHSLLKPGTGKLGLLEVVHNDDPIAFPFCLLPGWWLVADDFRGEDNGPLMPEEMWDKLFHKHGFNGVEGAIADWPNVPQHHMSAYWTTKLDNTSTNGHMSLAEEDDELDSIVICRPFSSCQDVELANAIAEELSTQSSSITVNVQELKDGVVFNPQGSFCIFLDGSDESYMATIASEAMFKTFQNILLRSKGALWLSPMANAPKYSQIKGILRSFRLEDSSRKLVHFNQVPTKDPNAASRVIARVTHSLLHDQSITAFREQELVWENEMIHVPRLRRLQETERCFALEAGLSIREKRCLQAEYDSSDCLRMTVDAPGSIDSIYYERYELMEPGQALADDELIVKVDAVGFNFRDLLLLLGAVPWALPGVEGAGTVVQVGGGVKAIVPGDRVVYMLQEGGFSTHVKVPSVRACKVPDTLSITDAAGVPAAYTTALMCLDRVARLQRGESVLIHAATGGVGQACVQLAQRMGAVIFATAGSEEKREFLRATYAIPEDHIWSSRTNAFKKGILAKTNNKGVDVIVNSLSGDLLQDTWALVAEFGRFVEIGKKDILDNSHLSMRQFYRNVTFTCLDLDQYFCKKPQQLKECLTEIMDMLQRGAITPVQPTTVIPASDSVTGFRKLQSGTNIGKIVATMGSNQEVMAECPSPLQLKHDLLRSDATYLITGGTGGIGRSLVPWMLENGACNVILLGRSGCSNPEVLKVVNEYNRPEKGCHVRALACDVASREDLSKVISSVSDLPPVRGVIHGSLYLRDALFMNSTFDDWQKIKAPKVDAAWHLHELLPRLDFFVALSSGTSVVGNIGQSLYSGTSTFLDAFVQWRTQQGLPSVSISLPIVDDVGYVVERDGLRSQLGNSIGIKLSIRQVHDIIKGAIIGASSGLNHNSRSIIWVREDSSQSEGWEGRSHYLSAVRRREQLANVNEKGANSEGASGQGGVLEALSRKVSTITMIDLDEVTPTRSLLEYGLDSLVSVELRNWVKREYGVDMALTHIVGSANLQALADRITSQQK